MSSAGLFNSEVRIHPTTMEDKLLFTRAHLKEHCHCEPVRTLAWQSPYISGIYEKRTNALTNRPELLGDCHTSVRAGSQ